MPTVAAKKPVRRVVRKAPVKKAAPITSIPGLLPPIPPPPGLATAADLLADVRSGEFGKGVDWDRVDRAFRSRKSRRVA